MSTRTTMVTGANGFVGQHTVRAAAARGDRVIAVSRQEVVDPAIADLVDAYYCCDLAELDETRKLPLDEVDAVINLAGLAAVGESFKFPELYRRVNAAVLDTLCTVAQECGNTSLRVIAVSSGAVYAASQPMPLTEDSAVDPSSSPYAASKLAMEDRAAKHRAAGTDCVVVRPFNHIGPGQGPGFLLPDLWESVFEARANRSALRVGNLSTRRDYTDVRDVAGAYHCLSAMRHPGYYVFNICSGRSVAGSELLAMLLRELGEYNMQTELDPARVRAHDVPDIVGNSARLAGTADWRPRVTMARSIRDFIAGAKKRAQ